MTWPAEQRAADPAAARQGTEGEGGAFWDAAALGAGVGGAAVWGLAVAARAGWLRALLDLYPRPSWERITWVLIPVLLLLPLVIQGVVVARLGATRPAPAGRGIAGSIAGTVLGLAAGLALFILATRVLSIPLRQALPAARAVPTPLTLGCGGLLIAATLRIIARSTGKAWLRTWAVPVGVAAAVAAWLAAREWVLAASYVLDSAETAVFFVAVAAGGALGAAWSVAPAARPR